MLTPQRGAATMNRKEPIMTETLAADRVAIADLLSRYWQAADGRDTPSVAALFAEDGVFAGVGMPELKGRAAILDFFMQFHRSPAASAALHFFAPPAIDVDGDTAAASCLMLYVAPTDSGSYGVAGLMRYDDELVRHQGRWLFGRRNVSPIGDLNA
jgi:uncharacterized protein (TIGR02246 family)